MLELAQTTLPAAVADSTYTNLMLGVGVAVYIMNTVFPKLAAAMNRRNGKTSEGDPKAGSGTICQQHSTALATLTESVSNLRADLIETKARTRVDMAEIKATLYERRSKELTNG